MTQVFRNRRGVTAKPDRGVFPIDHHGQCDTYMEIFTDCLKQMNGWNTMCRQKMKNYLKCRVRKNLMTREDFDATGFSMDDRIVEEEYYLNTKHIPHHDKERTGFVAGIGPRTSKNRFTKIVVREKQLISIPPDQMGKCYPDPPYPCDPPPIPPGFE